MGVFKNSDIYGLLFVLACNRSHGKRSQSNLFLLDIRVKQPAPMTISELISKIGEWAFIICACYSQNSLGYFIILL
jgi:glycine cleavage system regulatory protein